MSSGPNSATTTVPTLPPEMWALIANPRRSGGNCSARRPLPTGCWGAPPLHVAGQPGEARLDEPGPDRPGRGYERDRLDPHVELVDDRQEDQRQDDGLGVVDRMRDREQPEGPGRVDGRLRRGCWGVGPTRVVGFAGQP